MWRTPLGDEGGGIAASEATTTDSSEGHTMNVYEFQQFRSAELIRRGEQERLAREVARSRRAARREAAERARGAAENEPQTHRPRRLRSTRTA
jgi:hypothetical protein